MTVDTIFNIKTKSWHGSTSTSFSISSFDVVGETGISFTKILEAFISSGHFKDKVEYAATDYFTHMAFVIGKITSNDFREAKGIELEEMVNSCLEKDMFSSSDKFKREYKDTYEKSKWYLNDFSIHSDQMFHINMNWFLNTEKLVEISSIWDYALTFIIINPDKNRLLMLDYGMD